jgi:hypothetical protein
MPEAGATADQCQHHQEEGYSSHGFSPHPEKAGLSACYDVDILTPFCPGWRVSTLRAIPDRDLGARHGFKFGQHLIETMTEISQDMIGIGG